jgi:hypothetical protein
MMSSNCVCDYVTFPELFGDLGTNMGMRALERAVRNLA